MKLVVIAVGRLKSGPERELCERYAERFRVIAKAIGVSAFQILELAESGSRRAEDRMQDEAERIAAAIPAGATLMVFDERGRSPASEAFADMLRKQREAGVPALALVIGGPDGLHVSLRDKATSILSFGQMTMPHQIVRALAFEQLYRAATILTGHPYHRS